MAHGSRSSAPIRAESLHEILIIIWKKKKEMVGREGEESEGAEQQSSAGPSLHCKYGWMKNLMHVSSLSSWQARLGSAC
jgi:hypothetical protein